MQYVRKQEYKRLDGQKRTFIKGQKYVLLSHREKILRELARAAQVAAAQTYPSGGLRSWLDVMRA